VIGVVAGWQFYERTTPNWFLEAVYRGAARAGADQGCDVLLSCGVDAQIEDPRSVRPGWPHLGDQEDFVPVGPWNTDGLVVVSPLRTAERRRYALELQEAGFPVVFIGEGDGQPAVAADVAPGFRESLEHLRAHGHRGVAFVAGDPMDLGDSFARLKYFRELRVELGLDENDELVAPGLHTEVGGYLAMKAILDSGRRFSAVVASNDISAIGAMRALFESGRRVPEDVAVIGCDDQPAASAHVPPLASISYPLVEAGARAVALLARRIRGEALASETTLVPTKLIRRRSCGCLHRDASTVDQDDEGWVAPGADPVTAMLVELERAPPHLAPDAVVDLCLRLESGLMQSIMDESTAAFREALMTLLQRVEAAGDRAQRWHAALTCLRRTVRGRLTPSEESAAEDLIHMARVALGESADRQDSRRRSHDARQVDLVSALTVPLQSAQDEPEILALLAEHAPALGVRPVCLALYEAEEDDPVAWSRILPLGTGPGASQPVRVATLRLRTDQLLRHDEALCLAVLPLVRQGRPMGFLAFEAETLAPGAAIARQLAVALESVRLQAAVRAISLMDELTGLHNRRFFEQELRRESERTRRFGRPLALVLLDVDHFKEYNDTFGHPAGDEALRRVARHLTDAVPRRLDAVTRYGGEEFALLLSATDEAGAQVVAERIRATVERSDGFLRPLTVSIGIAVMTPGIGDGQALVQRADEALYRAKHEGRNRVTVDPGLRIAIP